MTVYEAQPVAGGMLATGIPDTGCRNLLAEEIRLIEQVGVMIRTGLEVGHDSASANARQATTRSISPPARSSPIDGVPGEDLEG